MCCLSTWQTFGYRHPLGIALRKPLDVHCTYHFKWVVIIPRVLDPGHDFQKFLKATLLNVLSKSSIIHAGLTM